MRKILFGVIMFAICAMVSSCASKEDKECSKIADAMVAEKWEEVTKLADQLYANKAQCSASNLADLSLAYNSVANMAKDNTSKLDAIKKVVDCYESAVSKDADVTKKCFDVAKVDMASIVAQYKEGIPQFEAVIAAEQNGGVAAATETASEEATEETSEETEAAEE